MILPITRNETKKANAHPYRVYTVSSKSKRKKEILIHVRADKLNLNTFVVSNRIVANSMFIDK